MGWAWAGPGCEAYTSTRVSPPQENLGEVRLGCEDAQVQVQPCEARQDKTSFKKRPDSRRVGTLTGGQFPRSLL